MLLQKKPSGQFSVCTAQCALCSRHQLSIQTADDDFLLGSEELKGALVRHAGDSCILNFKGIREVSAPLTVRHNISEKRVVRLCLQVHEMFSNRVEHATSSPRALMSVARASTSPPLHKPLERITRPPLYPGSPLTCALFTHREVTA